MLKKIVCMLCACMFIFATNLNFAYAAKLPSFPTMPIYSLNGFKFAPTEMESVFTLENQMGSEMGWILKSQFPSGAIPIGPGQTYINPYFANRAAIALTTDFMNQEAVHKYIIWYFNHIQPDGSIPNFEEKKGKEIPFQAPDSVDAYAATFIHLLRVYIDESHDYTVLASNQSKFHQVLNAILQLEDSDFLTWAKPNYPIKYLMDNCEVYQGISDYAYLCKTVLHSTKEASQYQTLATKMKASIMQEFLNDNQFYVFLAKGVKKNPDWNSWYPDATAELFPIAFGIVDSKSTLAHHLYQTFNQYFSNWDHLKFPDTFPWAILGNVAADMGDIHREQEYELTVARQFSDRHYPWTTYESGWFIMMLQTTKFNLWRLS